MNFLLSYHYWKERAANFATWLPEYFPGPPDRYPTSFFIDSGAFTAATMGVNIDIKEYATWLHRNLDFIDAYANLDVIRSWRGTAANQKKLEAAGLSPLPVFHTGDPWSVFDRMCAEHDYVAVGGVAGYNVGMAELGPYLVRAHQVAEKRGTGLHGFGMTRWKLIRDFPWKSVDSSSWTSGQRYGQAVVWNGRRMVRFAQRDDNQVLRNAAAIRRAGFDPYDFIGEAYHYRYMSGLCGVSWLLMEQTLQRTRPGFRLYLADATPATYNYLWQAWWSIQDTGRARIEMWTADKEDQ